MKDNCLDIGIIQAFLDGELDHSQVARVSNHIAMCDGCSVMLADAENESAIVFPALERELNSLVPTQRLWYKINDSLAEERGNRPFWQRAWAFLTVALVNPSLASAAGLIIVAGLAIMIWTGRAPETQDLAVHNAPVASQPSDMTPQASQTGPVAVDEPAGVVQGTASRPDVRVERASFTPAKRPGTVTKAVIRKADPEAAADPGYMPGEESYVKTIASLSRTLQGTKDGIMRPAQRIAYERDMAVVNDAIDKLREEVKRNPKNESAKQVLYSSYQNKIDLLNSVSQKQELMASISR